MGGIKMLIAGSPWRNAYWFARMLLNSDKYGGVGKSKEKQLLELVAQLEVIIGRDVLSEAEKVKICRDMITSSLTGLYKSSAKVFVLVDQLVVDLNGNISSVDDVSVFIVTVKYIVAPINSAIALVPSSDAKFCRAAAKSILDSLGESAVGKVVGTWDDMGVKGCLDAERSLVVSYFTKLRANMAALSTARSEVEDNMVLTAFVQEFERRLGQKRKKRSGTSLEDVSTFLFGYYGFTSHSKPDHFQTDIEVDKWFKCKDGWSIGISCKRTLRERWKQVSSADSNALSRYKIKEIWHLLTFDKDLSDEKLTMLGQQRQIFYLAETTDRFKSASAHVGMKNYVRPLSRFISDIRREQRGT
jgi:hypothetical protein